jgi:hypothetical protein
MDHNQITIMVLTILSAVTGPVAIFCLVDRVREARLRNRLITSHTKMYGALVAMQNQLAGAELKLAVKPVNHILDPKTKDLLKLATGKANANEASAAAIQVCKRLARIVNSN